MGNSRGAYPAVLGLLVTVSLFLLSASLPSPLAASPRRCPQPRDAASPPGRAGSRTVELPTDLPAVRELQKAFENGHQPWRGDPTRVAAVAVSEVLGTDSTVEPASGLVSKLAIECETQSESVVVGEDTSYKYRVYLKRLLPPQRGRPSIWTAIRVVLTPVN